MSVKQPKLYNEMADHNFMWLGRRESFQQLMRFDEKVSSEKDWALLVSGKPGSGKTWLLRLFLFTALEKENWWRIICGASKSLADQLLTGVLVKHPGWRTLNGMNDTMMNVLRQYGTESVRRMKMYTALQCS